MCVDATNTILKCWNLIGTSQHVCAAQLEEFEF